ncbi:MAG: hypothetical protein A2138_21165 [Deltaproteobacteria bacterium RBG_16_71_12]|nr:MAG: hypothetical protein A2138_21165 [Deltaproteobacteria bacterium RBG_16_71_12]
MTIRPWRSGIIIKTPIRPPNSATNSVRDSSSSKPINNSDGSVKATPAAIDSPALPVVCTMLFSRMLVGARCNAFCAQRNSVIDKTATGIEADTVRPTLRPR